MGAGLARTPQALNRRSQMGELGHGKMHRTSKWPPHSERGGGLRPIQAAYWAQGGAPNKRIGRHREESRTLLLRQPTFGRDRPKSTH